MDIEEIIEILLYAIFPKLFWISIFVLIIVFVVCVIIKYFGWI
ncbi:hypothetical protein [Methanococcus maripaludis]|nr:hypothetical protein [Methanococcus maripaludis]